MTIGNPDDAKQSMSAAMALDVGDCGTDTPVLHGCKSNVLVESQMCATFATNAFTRLVYVIN